jgi:lysine N6-hydroxylase
MNNKSYDLLGVGVGPSNLSLAALLAPTNLSTIFFEKQNSVIWHGGMLLDESELQVHYLKDCVTLADPTSPYSFLEYLNDQNRLYQFLNRKTETVSRFEFNIYYQWVASKISCLCFGEHVEKIRYDGEKFTTFIKGEEYYSQSIVCGTGQVPYIPDICKSFINDHFFHTSEYLYKIKKNNISNKTVCVIGGGQSGAEIVNDILSKSELPNEIIWVGKRLNFHPLEDSCFANEFYTPCYTNYFFNLPKDKKERVIRKQVLTSDGISQNLVDKIYKKIYEIKFIHQKKIKIKILPYQSMTAVQSKKVLLLDLLLDKKQEYEYDILILSTGYCTALPSCMDLIKDELTFENNNLVLNEDYSVSWAGKHKIFFQNAAKHSHGIGDPNLSLIPYKNTKIINSILEDDFYKKPPCTMILNCKNETSEQIISHNEKVKVA